MPYKTVSEPFLKVAFYKIICRILKQLYLHLLFICEDEDVSNSTVLPQPSQLVCNILMECCHLSLTESQTLDGTKLIFLKSSILIGVQFG